MTAGEEFGKDKGKRMLIDKGLYGLQSSAARFHDKLASTLRLMGFKPCKADHDLRMKDKGYHWEYIATYVDDLLVFSKRPMAILDKIRETYDLKGVGAPEYYLGGDVDMLNINLVPKNLDGILEVGYDEKDKNLSMY